MQAFSDTTLQGHIMYLFGKLAFEEAQFGQATNFCKAAQVIYNSHATKVMHFVTEFSHAWDQIILINYFNPKQTLLK